MKRIYLLSILQCLFLSSFAQDFGFSAKGYNGTRTADGISVWVSTRVTNEYTDDEGDEMVDFTTTVYVKNVGSGDYISGCVSASFKIGSIVGCGRNNAIYSPDHDYPSKIHPIPLKVGGSNTAMWFGSTTYSRTFVHKGWMKHDYEYGDFVSVSVNISRDDSEDIH